MPSRQFVGKLAAISILLMLPLWVILAFKWPINADFIVYATDLNSFSAQFWAGEIYPRWLMSLNDGFGSPVFLFYSPLAFYVASLFEWLAPFDPHGYGRALATINLAIFAAGITSYRWLRQHMSEKTAQEGALIYAGFPYLLTIIYCTMGIGQVWSMVWLPLILEAALDLTRQGWRALPKFSIGYALLALSHLPTTLVFAAIPCLYVAVFAPHGKRIQTTALAGIGAMLGAFLAAIYLFPAVSNKPWISSEHFLDGTLIYSNNFYHLRSILGLFCIPLPLLGLYLELPKTMRRQMSAPVRFWIAILMAIFFMITPFSRPIWDYITPLHYLQFPFRFFNAMVPGAVFLAISWVPHLKKNRHFYLWATIVSLIGTASFSEETYFFETNTKPAYILEHNLNIAPEYRTHWMENAGITSPWKLPDSYVAMEPTVFAKGQGQATILSQTARSITLHADVTSSNATIELKRFYFPGWKTQTPNVGIEESRALLAISVPSGSHDIVLTLPWFDGERTGLLLSLMTLTLLAGLNCFSDKRPKTH